jgi:hypothetical protein
LENLGRVTNRIFSFYSRRSHWKSHPLVSVILRFGDRIVV